MNHPYPTETGCCPRFDPGPWEGQEFQWQQKLFVKDRVKCLFYMPLGFGKVITRIMAKIAAAEAFTEQPPLSLSDHTSRWNMDLYVEVPKEVPGLETARLSGSYVSRVFEGPYRETGRWCQQTEEWVRSRGQQIKKMFMYYTTCPKCARHYGKNYVVILAQI